MTSEHDEPSRPIIHKRSRGKKGVVYGLSIVAMLFLLVRCNSDNCGTFPTTLTATAPTPTPTSFQYFNDLDSHFAIPIRLSLADAQSFAANKAGTLPFKKENFHVGPIWVENVAGTLRAQNIKLEKSSSIAEGVAFSCDVTGNVSGQFQLVVLHPTFVGDVKGRVKGAVTAKIDTDWSLSTTNEVSVDIQRLEIKNVGDIASVVGGGLAGPAAAELRRVVEEGIKSISSQLKSAVEDAWTKMHLVQRISDSPPVWLTFQPTEVSMAPVRVTDTEVILTLGIKAKPRLYIERNAPKIDRTPLPGLILNPNLSNRFDVTVPIQASLDELLLAATESLNGKAFEFEGIRISTSKASASTFEDKLLLKFDFCATRGHLSRGAKGTLYATARVVYDSGSETLRLSDLDYSLESTALLKTASWLLKPKILESVSDGAKVNARPLLDQARRDAQQRFESLKTPDGIKSWKLTIDQSLRVLNVQIRDGRLFFLMKAEGQTDVEL